MKLDINAYGREFVEYDSILQGLKQEHLVSFKKMDDGRFEIKEMCDNYYVGWFTKEQMLKLIVYRKLCTLE